MAARIGRGPRPHRSGMSVVVRGQHGTGDSGGEEGFRRRDAVRQRGGDPAAGMLSGGEEELRRRGCGPAVHATNPS
jgi:hypothetical protein